MNKSYKEGELAISQRRAVISLLYKKGDRINLKNWRPVSLLNIEQKMAILFLDYEKAFDTVEWDFLIKTLLKFKFYKLDLSNV